MTTEHFYIAEFSIEFSGETYYEEIIETQMTDQQTLIELGRGTEIVFENDRLTAIYDYFEKNHEVFKKSREIKENELDYKKPTYPIQEILKYDENTNGYHQLGGNFSNEFNEPICNLAVPFQYIGYINNADPNFSWLPYKLNLTFPIYLGAEIVFLDYTDNQNPKVYNIEELQKYKSVFSEINSNSSISFKIQKFDLLKSKDYSLNVNSGIPNWIQGQHIPLCPVTGKKMRFVCQIYRGSEVDNTNIIAENEWNKNYFKQLDFIGDDFYVFFQPESNIVCLFTQGT